MRRMVRRMIFVGVATLVGAGAYSLTATTALPQAGCNDKFLSYPGCQPQIDYCCDNGECACSCTSNCQCGGVCSLLRD